MIERSGFKAGEAEHSKCAGVVVTGGLLALLLFCASSVYAADPALLLHNSNSTGSTKWAGGWGIEGGRYGKFTCATCHAMSTANIKRVKQAIDAPDTAVDFPGGNNASVVLNTVVNGSADLGDDADNHPTSTRVCEVCHSRTAYHNYNATGQADKTHYNQTDCLACHKHRKAFKAACDDCHGNPPTAATLGGTTGLANDPTVTGSSSAGAHAMHVTTEGYGCLACHNGYKGSLQMPNGGNLNIGFNAVGVVGGTYNGRVGGKGYTAGVSTTVNQTGAMTCASLYCHGSTIGATVTADWDGGTGGACGDCHGANAANPPASPASGRSHPTHAGSAGVAIYRNGTAVTLACAACHGAGYTAGTAAPDGHVDGAVRYNIAVLDAGNRDNGAVAVTYNSGKSGLMANLAPSSTYRTCANVNCHWGVLTPAWNTDLGAAPGKCVKCHSDGAGTTLRDAAPAGGAHAAHLESTLLVNGYVTNTTVCGECHGTGADSAVHAGHIDFGTTLGNKMTSYNAGDQTCVNACHYSDTATKWTPTGTIQCDDCHRYNTAAGAEYIGPTVVDPGGVGGASKGMAAVGYGSHLKGSTGDPAFSGSTDWDAQCKKCHPYHSGGVTVPLPPSNWAAVAGTASTLNGSNMQTQLGLQYTVSGGVHLGGTVAGGASEAEMCWGCHGIDDTINEWGYNADTNGATFPETAIALTAPSHSYWTGPAGKSYNYGWLYTDAAWTPANLTAAWVDASGKGMYRRDAYQHSSSNTYALSRRISSVHSANFNVAPATGASVLKNIDGSGNVIRTTSQILETRDQIRCSYCHDVHDLNRAAGDAATGRPYLRGSWMGNPYAADVPPMVGYPYPSTGGGDAYGNRYADGTTTWTAAGATPRLFVSTGKNKGGYFIDQNSRWPTRVGGVVGGADLALADVAGICTICHGTDVSNMDYYTGTTMWRGGLTSNGHANSTLGGGGYNHAKARNIFDGRRSDLTAWSGFYMAGQDGVNYSTNYGKNYGGAQLKGVAPFGSTFSSQPNDGGDTPMLNTGWYGGTEGSMTKGGNGQYTSWYYGSTTLTTAAAIGHDGSRASGNQRAHSFSCSKCHSPHATGLPALLITNCLDKTVSNWTAASGKAGPNTTNDWGEHVQNNCHAKNSTANGWHTLAPGQ